MGSLRDFKNAADEIMKDITVSNELREKTLIKCEENRKIKFIKASILPSICVGTILIIGIIWGVHYKLLNRNYQIGNNEPQNASVMAAPGDSASSISPGGETGSQPDNTQSVDVKNIEDAKKYLEVEVLEPYYLPDGYTIERIYGIGNDAEKINSLWIECVSDDKTFFISVEKEIQWNSFEEYTRVDINGVQGYLKSHGEDLSKTSELRWLIGQNLYTIGGAISEDDALRVARLLK